MEKWEYDYDDFKEVHFTVIGHFAKISERGKAGWELVTVVRMIIISDYIIRLYWKRKLSDNI